MNFLNVLLQIFIGWCPLATIICVCVFQMFWKKKLWPIMSNFWRRFFLVFGGNFFFFTFFQWNFSVRSLQCFQNLFILPTKSWKNCLQKLLIIGPNIFFSQSSPAHSPQPRSSLPFYKKTQSKRLSIGLWVIACNF